MNLNRKQRVVDLNADGSSETEFIHVSAARQIASLSGLKCDTDQINMTFNLLTNDAGV